MSTDTYNQSSAPRKFGVSSTRFTFTLNVDYAELDKILGCIPVAKSFNLAPPKHTTKIEDILGTGNSASSCTFGFLDPSKKSKRWIVTMKDAIKQTVLPQELPAPVKCWWCHDSFTTRPLGCPIKLVSTGKDSKETYYSHLSKKDVTVSHSGKGENNETTEYYLTKGYLCCWECLMGFGESVRMKPEFHECIQLIYHMFKAAGGEGKIMPAPHYTMKQEYGGPLTAQEYKGHHEVYQATGNSYVRMVPIGELFEVTSKF
jgi:hypothetical protein